jgi:hypothetical protein
MSPQIINSDFGLYSYFKVASSLLRNSLTSPEGALFMIKVIKLDVLVIIELHRFKVLLLAVMRSISTTEMLIYPNKNTHTSLL